MTTMTQQKALRMMRDGQSLRQIIDETGIPEVEIRRLAAQTRGPAPAGPALPMPATPGEITELPVKVLTAHPANVRSDLDIDDGFVETIAEHGILQPLLVMRQNGIYVLLDGHRRLEAARRTGLARIPVRLHDAVDDEDATLLMLVTGLQKADLDPIDEAAAYQRLVDAGRTQQQISQETGKDPGHVSRRLLLLLLTDEEKAALRQKALTLNQAFYLAQQRSKGRLRGPETRGKAKRVFHLNTEHRLAKTARELCTQSGHTVALRLGPACGRCWEDVIRHDERHRVARAATQAAS